MNFGTKLRQLRSQLGLTQDQVAQNLHISLRSYASYELGERLPRTIDDYSRISRFYNVPLGFLYDETLVEQHRDSLISERRALVNESLHIISDTLEKEGWFTKQSSWLGWDLEAFDPSRNAWLMVNLKLFHTHSGAKILGRGSLFHSYGELTVNKIDKTSDVKVLLVTNSQDFIRLASDNPPINLPFTVSIRWLDLQTKVLNDYIALVK